MRELMVHPLGNDLGQRNALWPQSPRELERPSHRRSAVLRGNTHDHRRPIRKRGLEDIVMRARAEAAHLDRHAADRGGCQIARNDAVWHMRRHGVRTPYAAAEIVACWRALRDSNPCDRRERATS